MWKFWSNKKTIPKQVDHFPEEVQLYLRQIEEGRKIKSSVRETSYVVFDLETTGLNTAKDHILSFAFVRVENGQIRLKDRLEGYLNIGENANLSLFDPEHKYLFTKENVISKSKNSCFINSNLNGKAYGIISNNLVKVLGN